MWVGIREMGHLPGLRWLELAVGGSLVAALWLLGFRAQSRAAKRQRERRMEEELEAYSRLDVRLSAEGDVIGLSKQVSRLMAEKSAFSRAAMMVRDTEGLLSVAASARMDDAMVQLLNAWGAGIAAAQRDGGRQGGAGLGVRIGARSFAVRLGEMPAEVGYPRAIVVPLRTTSGRMVGALAVGADGLMGVRRSALTKALEPIEALAYKVERSMEDAALAERLLRAERLAGLGLMAGGMAHALNNPLTAVLGFAELIAATTGEVRVKEDAGIIVIEAMRMRQTLEMLMEFWQPAMQSDEGVDVSALIREMATACGGKLESRGVRLVVQTGDEAITVKGNQKRLRQMLEHLLNNAAQALADGDVAKTMEDQVIRLSVGQDGAMAHLIVSDTGPGFREPGRVFELGKGAGLGLSICYRIVHEHGGEISAFNLHPHGAAVAVELPVDFAGKKSEAGLGQRTYSVSV
jgi:signal transduction histidine kinase